MKRKKFLGYTGAGLLTALMTIGTSESEKSQAQSPSGVTIQWFGHSCFLFTGQGVRILVNPFQTIGCTAKYQLPKVPADLVLISSRLLDEGRTTDLPGNPKIFSESGVYDFQGIKIQGITIAHDREKGRRFGTNVVWSWTQAGIKIVHLGGAAAPIGIEEKILMGSPDLALIPVGGGPKAYNPQEAIQAIQSLNAKIIIPTQYLTTAADKSACELLPIEDFLQLTQSMSVNRLQTDKFTISRAIVPKEGRLVVVLNETNTLKS